MTNSKAGAHAGEEYQQQSEAEAQDVAKLVGTNFVAQHIQAIHNTLHVLTSFLTDTQTAFLLAKCMLCKGCAGFSASGGYLFGPTT